MEATAMTVAARDAVTAGADVPATAGPEVRAAYGRLAEYVRDHGSIRVAPRSLSVPREAREGLYACVDDVRHALGRQVLGEALADAQATARMCAASRDRLVRQTNLTTFKLADLLERFLIDPLDAVTEPALGVCLDGVQRGSSADELVAQARTRLPGFCAQLTRAAYEGWAYYGVVAALEPVRFWGVWSPDTVEAHAYDTDAIEVATQASSPERRMPEAVFRTRDGRCFAMKSEVARELDFYGIKIVRRRDHSAAGNTAQLVAHRALLLYRLRDVADVDVVAERDKGVVTPPDLAVEYLRPEEMSTPAYVSAFVARVNALNARRPFRVITRGDVGSFPEGMLEDASVCAIQRTAVGTDERRLAEIARELHEG